MSRKQLFISLGLLLLCGALLLWSGEETQKKEYYRNEGIIFGTYYSIQYEATEDYHEALRATLMEVDSALSMFNPASVLSRINRNEDVETNPVFEMVFATAQEVSAISGGALDMTVAPLVNAWGFGFRNKETMTPQHIDSLLTHVGYEKLALTNHHIVKQDKALMLDASAIAKGYGCDCVAQWLQEKGVKNLLVDIGGEVVALGNNSKGEQWKIGITKPVDDPTGTKQELQDVVFTHGISMASSGNYRNFYYDGKERRSHTIDPRTGYPVQHSLLSATVVASTCARADALATACMVLGEKAALDMIEATDDAECYLIVADGDENRVVMSSNFKLTEE